MADCKVRIYLPLKDDLTPDTLNVGHYDIQVVGTVSLTIPVDGALGKTYTNPIISYASGCVSIYNNGNYTLNSKTMLCSITYSGLNVSKLEEWLNLYCVFTSSDKNDGEGPKDNFSVTGDGFETYSYATHSCFAACARWLSLMGNDTLKNIYEHFTYPNGTDKAYDPYGYTNYIAWAMFETYYKAWDMVQLKV